jgi:hypothetical protein
MVDAQPTTTKTGRPAVSGTCEVCGTRIFKMGRYEPDVVAPPPTPPPAARHEEHVHRVPPELEKHANLIAIAGVCVLVAIVLLNWLRRD